jgi:hypothetical protein
MRLPSRILQVAGLLSIAAGLCAQQTPAPTPPPAVSGKKTLVNQVPPAVSQAEEPPVIPPSENAPQPLGFESDIYCFGYLGALSEPFPLQVHGAESSAEQTDFITDDLLYVTGGLDRGLKVGDQYWIVTPEQEILHPVTGKSMGRFYQYRGRAEIYAVEPQTAVVRVTNSCTDIPMGSYLKPFEPVPIPLSRKSLPAKAGDPPSGKIQGRIVFSRDGIVALGTGNVLLIDLGLASGVSAGDFVTIYRYVYGEDLSIRPIGTYWQPVPPPPGVVVPRTYLGEAAVLSVGDRWSVVRVTDAFRLIAVGDEIELK